MQQFGPFRLDTVNHCLWRADERMALTPKAFDLLRYLVERADRLVSQDEILQALWPETYINPEGIRKYIQEIRKVLGDQPGQASFIRTLPKRGYQFVGKVTAGRTSATLAATLDNTGHVVGRDAALAQLNLYFDKAMSGVRQVVFVTGEAGIGKTTLVDLFQQQAAHRAQMWLARGQCIEGFGGKEAYYPMLEAVGSLVHNAADDFAAQTLARQAPTWLAQFPSLVNAEQREWLRREILGSTHGRMVREICEALEAMTAKAPLIVLLEDLHWADTSTLDFISAFARRRDPAKLLLIGTYRPADVVVSQSPLKGLKEDLLVRHLCQEIRVERLEEPDIAEYLAKAFAGNRFPAGLANMIHHHSGGNPLFLAAIVRDIVKRGLIAQDGGEWTLTAPLPDIYQGIPETLQQVVDLQFDQLSPEEQRILQSGSVAGERFAVWAVAVMLGISSTEAEQTCDRLARRQQFIRFVGIHEAANGSNSAHYEFSHALYRQALYRRLTSLDRTRLHRSLGEQLMGAATAGQRDMAAELALHFEQGRDYDQAARCLMVAAGNASRKCAHGDSIRVLQHALELTPLVAAGTRAALEIQILQGIGDAHYALGAMSDSAAAYETAAAKAEEAGLRTAQIDALAHLAFPTWSLTPERGNRICEQAIQVSRAHGDPLLLAQTQLSASCFRLLYDAWRKEDAVTCAAANRTIRRLRSSDIPEDVLYVYVQSMLGDYEEALQRAEALIIGTTNPAAYLLAVGAKTLGLMPTGRFGEVLQIIRTGRDLAQKNGESTWLFIHAEAWLRALCFDFEGVRRLTDVIMRSHSEKHAAQPKAIAMVTAGYAELYRERYAEALRHFTQVLDPKITPKFFLHWRWRMHARLGSGEARLQAGDIRNARVQIDQFLADALATAEPNMQALAWDAKARLAWAEKDSDGAREWIENALTILDEFEIPVTAWRVHATAWDLYSHAGDETTAEGHRARARELITGIADSFEPGEPLRESLLSAAPALRIFGRSASA